MYGCGPSMQVFVLGTLTSLWIRGVTSALRHELYAQTSRTNHSVACGICEARGGHLARRPALTDWDITFGNWSHLDDMDFWVDLIKTDSDEWSWGDQQSLNLSDIQSLPMTPAYNQTYTDWNCALWNMAEPFYMPALCSLTANVICEIEDPRLADCQFSDLQGKKISSTALTSSSSATFDDCKKECTDAPDKDCYAAHFTDGANGGTAVCELLKSTVTDSWPALPNLINDPDSTVTGKICSHYKEMSQAESDFVCNCGAIELPTTEEEKEKFVEEYQEEVKKELIVPTETLSATIRKKESAPDERPSSTGLGFLGVAMMVAVFGGLVLLDLTALYTDIKGALGNIKSIFVNAEEGSSDA